MYFHSSVKLIRLNFSYMKNNSKISVDIRWICFFKIWYYHFSYKYPCLILYRSSQLLQHLL